MCTLLFILSAVSIPYGLVYGATSNCNYVVDYFWRSVQPPTSAPTPAPSPSPSNSPTDNPTSSPTKSPFVSGETTPSPILIISDNTEYPTSYLINVDVGGGGNNFNAEESILKPLTFNYCYSFSDADYYFGDFSLKYECNTDNNLVRTIYYDTLQCDNSNTDQLIVQSWEQGTNSIKYVCDQSSNCNFAKLTNLTATTQSPTAAPTDDPTGSPTPGPTTSPTDSPTQIGTDSPTHYSIIINSPYPTSANIDIGIVDGGDDENWWERCDGYSAPTDTSNAAISYFPQNICVEMSKFTDIFNYDNDYGNSYDYANTASFGWFCDKQNNQYFMGIFNDVNCENLGEKLIVYSNNACIPKIDGNWNYEPYWTYIECGAGDTTDPFTPSPNAPSPASSPETPSPASSPVTASPASAPASSPTDPQTNHANSMFISCFCMITMSSIALQLIL